MIRRRRHKLKAEMNVVPYIDVMLVLLVIFMIAAPLIHQQSIEIDLPDSSAEVLDMPEDAGNDLMPLVLTVDAQGNYYVLVQGDTAANYNQVIDGIVLLQQGGASKVGLVTEQPPEETGTAEAKP